MASLEQFHTDTNQFLANALAAFERAESAGDLEAARIQFLGDRSGQLRSIQQALGALPKEDRPTAGKAFNAVKQQVVDAYESRGRALARERAAGDAPVDLTMP